MSHDPNSPEADREFNELYRAAQGHGGSHAPGNTSLNSIKNNPSRDGLTVKHSDFFVSEVNKTLTVADSQLERSEETDVTVTFVGARSGFTEEIMVNPNNFEWYVSDESKDLIKITKGVPASHPNKEDWGQSGDTEYGAFKIRIKNIAPCSDKNVTGYIRCKFKDDFNETIGASKGYNTELTGSVVLLKNTTTMTLVNVKNHDNYRSDFAYDNGFEESLTGQNTGTWHVGYSTNHRDENNNTYTGINSQNRKFKSLLDNDDDVVIRGSLKGNTYQLGLIYSVDVTWQKKLEKDDGSSEWVDIVLNDNQGYSPAIVAGLQTTDNPTGNAGQLLKSFKNGKSDKDSQPQLNVQGRFGGGLYRAKVTVIGDREDPFTCVFWSDQARANIHQRIPEFTVSGAGYGCHDDPVVLTISPSKFERTGSNIGNQVKILYWAYSVGKSYLGTLLNDGARVVRDNDGNSFDMTFAAGAAEYYTVKAYIVPSDFKVGDRFKPADFGYGIRYANSRITTNHNAQDSDSNIGDWYNSAPYRSKTLPPVPTPVITTGGRLNMSGTKMRWRWDEISTVAGANITYQVRIYFKNQTGGWYLDTDWTQTNFNGRERFWQIDNAPETTNHSLPNARVQIRIRAVVVPPSTGLAPGDTPSTCYSESVIQEAETLTCSDLQLMMPKPKLSVSSPAGGDKPTIEVDYDGTTWGQYQGENAFGSAPARKDYVRVLEKTTGAADSTYVDITQSIITDNNIPSSRVQTISGKTHIQFDNKPWFETNKTFGKGKSYRFEHRTGYTDETKTCFSGPDAHVIDGAVISHDAVYTFTPTHGNPTNATGGSHYGAVIAYNVNPFETWSYAGQNWFMMGRDQSRADHNAYAFGIGADNITDITVTGVHEPDDFQNAQGSGVAFEQLPSGEIGTHATYPVVNIKLTQGALNNSKVHKDFGNYNGISPGSGFKTFAHGVGGQTPWVLQEKVITPGLTMQKKQWNTRRLERTIPAEFRNVSGNYYENINKVTRIISRKS